MIYYFNNIIYLKSVKIVLKEAKGLDYDTDFGEVQEILAEYIII